MEPTYGPFPYPTYSPTPISNSSTTSGLIIDGNETRYIDHSTVEETNHSTDFRKNNQEEFMMMMVILGFAIMIIIIGFFVIIVSIIIKYADKKKRKKKGLTIQIPMLPLVNETDTNVSWPTRRYNDCTPLRMKRRCLTYPRDRIGRRSPSPTHRVHTAISLGALSSGGEPYGSEVELTLLNHTPA